jgi:hypothetical protein
MKKLILLITILCSNFIQAQTYNGPESIAFDAVNNRYLISNTANGRILARAANGTLSIFKSGISPAPYGIEIVGNTVFACCGGFIKGYDLSDGTQTLNVNTGATFLNGITSDGYVNLFATDFSSQKIYRINTSTSSFNVMAQNLVQSPNGIVYDQANNRLVFVNWGSNAPIKALSLTDSVVTTIATTTLGNCDGLAWNGLDTWYIAAWTGQKIVKYDRDFANAPITIATGMSSPADIYYNQVTDTLAIPNSGNNTVAFLGFPAIQNVTCSLLPLTADADQAIFEGTSASFGDSVLRFSLTNTSGLSFAYPLARITPLSTLPAGMDFGTNGNGFQVFASAWNPDSVVEASFFFTVTQAIPENTMLDFRLDITNLFPSNADTCFFTDIFQVNLNPGTILNIEKLQQSIKVFPNPSSGTFQIKLPNSQGNLSILDLQGRCLRQINQVPNNVQIGSETITQAGIYLLRWESNNQIIQHKLVRTE